MKPFNINDCPDPAKPSAKLPTLGTKSTSNNGLPTGVIDVDSYLAALHASIGDSARLVKNNFLEAVKALGGEPVPQAYSYATFSFMPDPTNYGLVSWPGLQPEALRKISRENTAPQMIIRSRVNDLVRYSGLSSRLWEPGWSISLMDASKTPTAQDRKDIKDAERFIWNCSRDIGYVDARERDAGLIHPFEMFLRTFADDALTFDGWALWTDMDSNGGVRSFVNLPAGSIRLAVPTRGYKGNRDWFACMVDETGNPVKPFTRKELTWRVRNPRNDPAAMGYGWSEIEMAIRLIQGFQAAIDLNVSTFDQSSIPNGMLLLKGDYFQEDQIDALVREWTNMKRGVSKLWGMPVMSIPADGEVEVLRFQDLKGDDVRYRDHMNMMVGMCCAIYNFPIRRLGMFASGHHKDNEPVQDAAIEIQGADDPGLPAVLTHLEGGINPYLLWTNWPHLKFGFHAKDPKASAREYEARKMARTWGEARAEADLPKLETVFSSELKDLARLMDCCPEDPIKAAVYQTVATVMLQAELAPPESAGEGSGKGGSTAKNGPRMTRQKDPAESQGHGHMGGIRRDSKAETGKVH